MLKLIFSDLDGTLLNSVKTVDEKTVECIKNLDSTRFIINTGRLPYNVEVLRPYVDLSNMVCGNGAYIKIDNKVVYNCYTDKDEAYALLDYAYSHDLVPRVFMESNYYITSTPNLLTFVKPAVVSKDELYDLLKKEEVYKIGFMEDDLNTLRAIEEFIKVNNKNMVCEYSTPRFLECHHKDASKGRAIDVVSNLLNISKNEILAIGDNENDLSMFDRGYHSACPLNASDKVKASVEYISDLDCDHDSMVDIIKHFL